MAANGQRPTRLHSRGLGFYYDARGVVAPIGFSSQGNSTTLGAVLAFRRIALQQFFSGGYKYRLGPFSRGTLTGDSSTSIFMCSLRFGPWGARGTLTGGTTASCFATLLRGCVWPRFVPWGSRYTYWGYHRILHVGLGSCLACSGQLKPDQNHEAGPELALVASPAALCPPAELLQ